MVMAVNIIEEAYTYAGIKALGSQLDGETLAQGLSRLNSMLNAWQSDNLFIPYVSEVVTTVTGSPISIGTGQTINVTRPRFIRDTSYVRYQSQDWPIQWVNQPKFNELYNKTWSSTYPMYGYYDNQFPVGHIYFWPKLSSSELHLQLDAILPQFADYTTDYPIDTGWQLALELSLAEKACIGIKNIDQGLRLAAMNARDTIRTNNAVIEELGVPVVVQPGWRNYYL